MRTWSLTELVVTALLVSAALTVGSAIWVASKLGLIS